MEVAGLPAAGDGDLDRERGHDAVAGAAGLSEAGRAMTSDEGHAWGFWNRISDNVLEDARALARELASGPTMAHAVTKKQLDAEWHVSIQEALDMEAEAQAECMQTHDFKRAYQAFAGKHRPVFRGD